MATYFGAYRKTTASWADEVVTTIYEKIKGQGSDVLMETGPDSDAITLGDVYGLSLTLIAAGTPVPPIEIPEFPALPDNSLPEAPVYPDNSLPPGSPGSPTQPIYLPGYPSQPIYLPPTAGQLPVFPPPTAGQLPVFPSGGYPGQLPVFPGYPSQPIYMPGYPSQPIYMPVAPGQLPVFPPAAPDNSLPEDQPEVQPL
jgi:hypothetical protein